MELNQKQSTKIYSRYKQNTYIIPNFHPQIRSQCKRWTTTSKILHKTICPGIIKQTLKCIPIKYIYNSNIFEIIHIAQSSHIYIYIFQLYSKYLPNNIYYYKKKIRSQTSQLIYTPCFTFLI